MPRDMIGQAIEVGNFVVYHSKIYTVVDLGENSDYIKLKSWSKARHPIYAFTSLIAVLPKGAVVKWLMTETVSK